MEKIKINKGHTNISYNENNLFFVQEKVINKFNHKIDYSILNIFPFVPKLITQTKEILRWEWINGNVLSLNPTREQLEEIARNFLILHQSKIKFPSFNIRFRINEYRKFLKSKNVILPSFINNLYKKINLILKKMDISVPMHSDLWNENIIVENKTNKIYFIDWEYANMGDKHFDLAYFIESLNLNKENEQIFLNAYGDYNWKYLINHKILVLYLTILWNNVQDKKVFDDEKIIKKLKEITQQLE